ncbi:MAG: hypothetical protein IJE10_06695 [Clostridia bacterium]|nr:hypothetical protein [Clostridia bacterium]
MKKWLYLILGAVVFFLLNVLLDFLIFNSVHLVKTIISAVGWVLLWIVLYALKIIKFK